jgi:hypothetical protein
MQAGRVVDIGAPDRLFSAGDAHEYTDQLRTATPSVSRALGKLSEAL